MKTIHFGRRTSAAAAAFAITGLLMTPMAFADDTGTPSPPAPSGSSTSSVTSGAAGAATDDPTTTTTTTTGTTTTTTTTTPVTTTTITTPVTTPVTTTATPPVTPLLRVGNTGWAVEDLQARLSVLGRPSGTIDGVYDAQVTSALAGFLRANGLPGDGSELSPTARDRLVAQTATPRAFSATSTGNGVRDLQVRLKLLGYWPYSITGTMEPALASRALTVQRAKDLPQSAVFDTRTWDRIKALTATPLAFSATSTGNGVRDLQIRLKLLGYWPYSITGTMEPALASRALTVQRAKDLPQSAAFDTRTWDRIKALTATPTQISSTASGATVKELQLRLRARSLWPYSITGVYDATVAQRVLTFQRVQNIPHSGIVDRRTWGRLVALTYTPGTFDRYRYEAGLRPLMPTLSSLDSRCRTGRAMCVDKGTRTLTWVVAGKPTMVMWARFGGPGVETREGTFSVLRKYEYVVSNLYFTPMPYSMFFSGGQAVHYSSNFARIGYAGSSHGCVNIGDYAQVQALYFASRIGDKVIVHR